MDKEISYIADTEAEKTEAKGAGVSFLGDSLGGELPFEYATEDSLLGSCFGSIG